MKHPIVSLLVIIFLYGCVQVVDKLPPPQPAPVVDISPEEKARLQQCIELLKIKEEVLKEWQTLPAGPSKRRTQLERKLVLITDGERICWGKKP